MSQHVYIRDCVVVRMGYDRPLDMVFCSVWKDGERLYSNIDDVDAGTDCQDVNYYRIPLEQLDIKVPNEMFLNVELDQVNRVGNKLVEY